jgi:hypothetical protein
MGGASSSFTGAAEVGFHVHRLAEERVRVAARVAVGVDREMAEIARAHCPALHVPRHQHRVERQEGLAHAALELPVRGGGERRGDGLLGRVRHPLHAAHHDHVVETARDRHESPAGRRGPGAAGRLDRRGLHAAEARHVGEEGTQLLLLSQHTRHHVADEQRADFVRPELGFRERRRDRPCRHVPAPDVTLLGDRHLSGADEIDLPHTAPRAPAGT